MKNFSITLGLSALFLLAANAWAEPTATPQVTPSPQVTAQPLGNDQRPQSEQGGVVVQQPQPSTRPAEPVKPAAERPKKTRPPLEIPFRNF